MNKAYQGQSITKRRKRRKLISKLRRKKFVRQNQVKFHQNLDKIPNKLKIGTVVPNRVLDHQKKSPIDSDTGNHISDALLSDMSEKKIQKKSSQNIQVLYIKRKIISIRTKNLLMKTHENHLTKIYEASKVPWYSSCSFGTSI